MTEYLLYTQLDSTLSFESRVSFPGETVLCQCNNSPDTVKINVKNANDHTYNSSKH